MKRGSKTCFKGNWMQERCSEVQWCVGSCGASGWAGGKEVMPLAVPEYIRARMTD